MSDPILTARRLTALDRAAERCHRTASLIEGARGFLLAEDSDRFAEMFSMAQEGAVMIEFWLDKAEEADSDE